MSNKNEIKIRRRFKCQKCKNIESHSNNRISCSRCGSALEEITEKEYYKLKKERNNEENKKEKKANKNVINEETDEQDRKKKKLRKNLSSQNIKDKEYRNIKSKKKDESEEEDEKDEESSTYKKYSKKNTMKKESKKDKKKNRNKSVKGLGKYLNNIVSNVLENLGIDGVGDIDFENIQNIDGSTIIINQSNNSPMQIVVNNQNVSNEVFDPIFSQFGAIFDDNFANNFSSNFASNFDGNFFDEVQRIVENNQQETSNGPTKDKTLSKLKRFNLTSKYCKKGKNGKIELPNCCICLSEIAKGKETVLLPCGHMFHWKCCLNWLKKNNTCPMCRFEIK